MFCSICHFLYWNTANKQVNNSFLILFFRNIVTFNAMPGQICAVASCKSNRTSLKKQGIRLVFHSFPKAKDLVSSTIRKEWINRCKRGDKFNSYTATICSLHFAPDDYERDLQNELLGLPLRRVLKKNTVPTLNLDIRPEKPLEKATEDTPCSKRVCKKKNKDLIESLLTKPNCNSPEPAQLLYVLNTSVDMPKDTRRSSRARKKMKNKDLVESLLTKPSIMSPEPP